MWFDNNRLAAGFNQLYYVRYIHTLSRQGLEGLGISPLSAANSVALVEIFAGGGAYYGATRPPVSFTTSRPITVETGQPIVLENGFYLADGMKISQNYYDCLWQQGRPAPFLQAREILSNNPWVLPDPRGAPGYFRYEAGGIEMIYNPTTGQIVHIQPIK